MNKKDRLFGIYIIAELGLLITAIIFLYLSGDLFENGYDVIGSIVFTIAMGYFMGLMMDVVIRFKKGEEFRTRHYRKIIPGPVFYTPLYFCLTILDLFLGVLPHNILLFIILIIVAIIESFIIIKIRNFIKKYKPNETTLQLDEIFLLNDNSLNKEDFKILFIKKLFLFFGETRIAVYHDFKGTVDDPIIITNLENFPKKFKIDNTDKFILFKNIDSNTHSISITYCRNVIIDNSRFKHLNAKYSRIRYLNLSFRGTH